MFLKYLKKFIPRENYFIHETVILTKAVNIQIGKGSEIWEHVIFRKGYGPIVIGKNTQIGPFVVIFSGSGVTIGDNVMIAPHCVIASGNHQFHQVNVPMRFSGDFSKGPIFIGDDVWIGSNCTILDGVKIGKGAIIGANSAVTKNVDAYDIVAGCPAKKISNRMELYGGN